MQSVELHANQHAEGRRRFPRFVNGGRASCLLDLAERTWTMTAIARELGYSERNVYVLLRSALRKLRRIAKRRARGW